ncbi:Uncharacterised protein [Neisseria meningitidis]|nr:Uncharacterised protein [Neisseria meningitidis]CWO75995.1 Uncharacterised protein [Neisseria meningitidis]CWS18764.1 Uncharacterised protein [Neisseria meningitidis]
MTEGKSGFIDKLGTACVASAYDVGVAVACQRDAGGTNPTGGIVALFQPVGIKTGNLAVGRQVGGCAKNGSTALSGNKGIGIVEKDRASTLPAFIIDKFAFPVFFP